HPHWWRYKAEIETTSEIFFLFLGIYITVVGFLGIVGNSTVIYIFCSTASLRTPANVLVINLAVCDLIFSSVAGFPMTSLSCFWQKWLWGVTGCKWYAFLCAATGLASINCLTAISIDRYLVITHPFFMLDKSSFKRVLFNMIVIWGWAVIWAMPPLFGWGDYIMEGFGVSCTFDYLTRTWANISFNYSLISFAFVVPLFIIVLCYVGIVREVMRCGRPKEQQCYVKRFNRYNNRADNQNFRQEIQITRVLACCVVSFCVCWMPYAIVTQIAISGFQDLVNPYMAEIPVMLAKSSAIWNPIIYALSHPRYINAL
ncbi:hypothetical protein HELRODRAFT_129809, partial [Helobdella robusta]|uniref:G-protein coupled receptors family 1 profile domain-containing protein n=1 Tax=Helobdella robusta TaxID=6412 RepID=T1EHS3_HELRO